MNNSDEKEEALTRELLAAIEAESEVTQRTLARRLGVALGLTNSYLKRCVRKGWVKVRQVPPNRYLYYLTPQGFSEKSRLTGRYLASSLAFYRRAGDSCRRAFDTARASGWRELVLCGASDLAEIACLHADGRGVHVLGVFDPQAARERVAGHTVWRSPELVPPHDGWLLTALDDPAAALERFGEALAPERGVVPDILGVRPMDGMQLGTGPRAEVTN
ncbi:MAG: winged helix-turn-helix transcriptional regulator [Gammaproteobacteria bacterium]|nr:winged helix-turn-helix transcriptional regulator [Gammaproteobacteria bacterium]